MFTGAFTCSVLAFSCHRMDCFGTYFTHAQSCDNVRVHSATERTASCLYLGAVISYDDFQKQTVELRVRAGWNNFRRLQPWLCKKHHVSLKMRLHLMRTCIIPTICYGIFYIGLTNFGIDLVVKTFHMMYRRILGHVPHLTQLRTSTVLDTHRICHPVLTLHQLVDQAHQSLSLALTRVPMHDILHCADWTSGTYEDFAHSSFGAICAYSIE